MDAFDPAYDYVTDVFTGPRKAEYQTNMAVDYARHATELYRMSDMEMNERFNRELTRAVRPFSKKGQMAERLMEMHKRHARTVMSVLEQQFNAHSKSLIAGSLPSSCMLAKVAGQEHLTSSWNRFADRIAGLLESGLPVICKTHKPKDEPHLQQICDGILCNQDLALTREFPFMRWSSSLTKPDWSLESLDLWVELKYVRKSSDIRQITEDIAADITKYGDNSKHVLFVIYDPEHLVIDAPKFAEHIVAHEGMRVHFVR
jgi:hypothetical protein